MSEYKMWNRHSIGYHEDLGNIMEKDTLQRSVYVNGQKYVYDEPNNTFVLPGQEKTLTVGISGTSKARLRTQIIADEVNDFARRLAQGNQVSQGARDALIIAFTEELLKRD